MPPKRNRNRSKKKKQINALAECVIPQEIMASILTRLPVKSLLRCKSVCKPWLELIASPNFIKLHHRQFPSDPKNENFMVYSLSQSMHAHTMSLNRVLANEDPMYIDHPYPQDLSTIDFVGSCNGVICLSCPPHGKYIILWNPAMRLWKQVKLSKMQAYGKNEWVSIGFGYDEKEDDFKVVRIVYSPGPKMKVKPCAEVYSARSDSWETIKVGSQFRVMSTKCNAIVGGVPYWKSIVGKIQTQTIQIVRFDFDVKMFKFVPMSRLEQILDMEIETQALMNWMGSLAFIFCIGSNIHEGRGCMRVVTFCKDTKSWKLEHIFDPLPSYVDMCMECTKSGKVYGLNYGGKVHVFDFVNVIIEKAQVENAIVQYMQICEYFESLVCFDGMEVLPEQVNKKEDEEDEDGPSTSGRPPADIDDELFTSQLHHCEHCFTQNIRST